MQGVVLLVLLAPLLAAATSPESAPREAAAGPSGRYSEFFYREGGRAGIALKASSQPNLQAACPMTLEWRYPHCGETMDGLFYRIVNNDTHEQGVITETCVKTASCEVPARHGVCRQQFRYHLMLVYLPARAAPCPPDSDDTTVAVPAGKEQLKAVHIKLPSHCVCMKPKPVGS